MDSQAHKISRSKFLPLGIESVELVLLLRVSHHLDFEAHSFDHPNRTQEDKMMDLISQAHKISRSKFIPFGIESVWLLERAEVTNLSRA